MDTLTKDVTGKFVSIDGDKYYQIKNVDQMNPFFISVVSASDHWLFISSTGCLSAGRIRPENALFPYKSVDYIHESAENTGSKTILKIQGENGIQQWEPFNQQHDSLYKLRRNIYKNIAGDKIIFEELNFDLGLSFKYQWSTSEKFGFVRTATLTNTTHQTREIELIDGIQNLLPSNTPFSIMQGSSALLDAYKWNEREAKASLATYSLYAKLSDRAEPAESLLATSVFSIVKDCQSILLSSQQLAAFRRGGSIEDEQLTRGVRGAYFIHKKLSLAPAQQDNWSIVADIDQSHSDLAELQEIIANQQLPQILADSVEQNHQELLKLMAGSDAYQKTAEDETSVHHYANVLFNNMRGGVVVDQYWVESADFISTLKNANTQVAIDQASFLNSLPEKINYDELLSLAAKQSNPQLLRLCHEYLPLTFGRRHGDPSRPWNHFEIKLKDNHGNRLLSYQGNWRDIFQNWEALGLSYPSFIKSFIAKFVNASTIDGYNPYRITKAGVDWELLEADDPWSNIGYWGDHQIIYLLKFLEQSDKYQPAELKTLLDTEIFSYANVPYEISPADTIFADAKNTVEFNENKQKVIESRESLMGSDARLLLDKNQEVYLANLAEKLLVPLLAKLGNLVLDGGIWLNTQRPEWNDANNAIVGTGLSMVTLYYMRRYVAFLQDLFVDDKCYAISNELAEWLRASTETLEQAIQLLDASSASDAQRSQVLRSLAKVAADYRSKVYQHGFSGKQTVSTAQIQALLSPSLRIMDKSIASNYRQDGLYNAYNIINYTQDEVAVDYLYPMLEGQVAVLSSGVLNPDEAVQLLDKLYSSAMFREDQNTFMLYPDRDLVGFKAKNRISEKRVVANPVLQQMIKQTDRRIIEQDNQGHYHFNAHFDNAGALNEAISSLSSDYPQADAATWQDIRASYEEVFNHQAFTGRSGTMFGYEGLGSIYWHMVSKLLLAVQENYFASYNSDPHSLATQQLAEYYYRVRAGIGFNKTPEVYGAFPTDPYSHTPKQAGAQQPGMTGQVKEEILTRFGELGLLVEHGQIKIQPSLLKSSEFLSAEDDYQYIDQNSQTQTLALTAKQLAFTYCQVPFVYQQSDSEHAQLTVSLTNGEQYSNEDLVLSEELSQSVFERKQQIAHVFVRLPSNMLLS
ncbi:MULTISPECIES: hypothetical protein [unclassified Agarivorans]|uniref:hypothetical protein n=1 Tax=unclassified Agarivorans TaxID=2636026 RepID=UPI0026E39AE5|nr:MULTISPECIES: hypothetical protein [unclassified Agarivorans]MDO6684651.1 hypothetical protein [Agarivorans sp. 3_MG-2023]MDO6714816.1 hypothetical protein [Agarivorans sp. 2_MG-2023]